jgi:hypothetical protein
MLDYGRADQKSEMPFTPICPENLLKGEANGI